MVEKRFEVSVCFIAVHTSEKDIIPLREAAVVGVASVMPFSGTKRCVPAGPEMFGHHGVFRRNVGCVLPHLEEGFAGHQHAPAGHTYRSSQGAHDVSMGESDARTDHAVHIGSGNFLVSQFRNGIKALVIGKQEQDVRFCWRGLLRDVTAAARQ